MLRKIKQFIMSMTSEKSRMPEIAPVPTMPDHVFWYIVERARRNTYSLSYSALWQQLEALETSDVIAFSAALLEKKKILATPQIWGVARLLNSSIDNKIFSDFLDCIVSNGKDFFVMFQFDPDACTDLLALELFDHFKFGDFSRAPAEVWREKTGEDPWLNDFANFPKLQNADLLMPGPSLTAVYETQKHLAEEYPELSAKFSSLAFAPDDIATTLNASHFSGAKTLH